MSGAILRLRPLELTAVEVLLCDADGNLFPSEEPAFEASCQVTNCFLAERGDPRRFTADELRRWAMGRNFRSVVGDLADPSPLDEAELETWVLAERRAVMTHLAAVLAPDPTVREPLEGLRNRVRLAVVSSSALARLDACFAAARLDDLFPPDVRFSAEDSLAAPTSKPDPAIYAHAARRLRATGATGLAVEDAVVGVRSAVAAGISTVGNLHFVTPGEREERTAALRGAGASVIVESWADLAALLGCNAAMHAT